MPCEESQTQLSSSAESLGYVRVEGESDSVAYTESVVLYISSRVGSANPC